MFYRLLPDHSIEPCEVLEIFKGNRIVDQTQIGSSWVSTVFLYFDHQYGNGPPMLFETMVFGGKMSQYQVRCSTWKQAVVQHRLTCDKVKRSQSVWRQIVELFN